MSIAAAFEESITASRKTVESTEATR